jgi:Uma2 family endonuclease
MQDLAPRRATYQDVLDAPEHMVAELLDGELVLMPRPAPRALDVASVLGGLLTGPFRLGINGPGGWWIIDEPELHLGEDVAVPDLGGWRRKRMPKLPETAWFDLAPDWACEVLSPKTRKYDKGKKRDLYARQGIKHLWHLDPADRQLEVFELTDGQWLLARTWRDDEEVVAAPFAAVPFRLGLLWAE